MFFQRLFLDRSLWLKPLSIVGQLFLNKTGKKRSKSSFCNEMSQRSQDSPFLWSHVKKKKKIKFTKSYRILWALSWLDPPVPSVFSEVLIHLKCPDIKCKPPEGLHVCTHATASWIKIQNIFCIPEGSLAPFPDKILLPSAWK